MKTYDTEEKNSEDSPITFGQTKNRKITKAMEFSELSEDYFYASGSIIFRRCFLKAMT